MTPDRNQKHTGTSARTGARMILRISVLILVVVAAGFPVYVRPRTDSPRPADAILILGGYGYERYELGLRLGEQGWATTVVISNPKGAGDRWLTDYCAQHHSQFALHCFIPSPPTTKGEGRELRRLADEHNWRTIIVVTFTPHISRARLILHRCVDGDLIMVSSPPRIPLLRWPFEYAYQTAGFIRAAIQPNC